MMSLWEPMNLSCLSLMEEWWYKVSSGDDELMGVNKSFLFESEGVVGGWGLLVIWYKIYVHFVFSRVSV